MGRIVTDATGDRWDVTQGDAADGRNSIRFRHQSGREYETASRRQVNELSDRQLLEMLEAEAQERQVTHGQERSADPDGYITE